MRLFSFLIVLGVMFGTSPANALTFSVSPAPQTVANGSEVTVDIRVDGFTNVAGYQFSMSWNPAVLEFLSVTPKLPGMSTSGNFNTANTANGTLAHLYPAQGVGPLSLPDGSILFTIKFWAAGAAGTSSPISFTAVPTPIAAYDGGLQPLTVTTLAGLVHIAAQGGFSVSGIAARASGTPVPGVLTAMSGDATGTDLTGVPGDYGFDNLAPGSHLTIIPAKTADPIECVSVRDILFISKHIFGLEPLPNPYAMVAADANGSKSITTFDATELRKLILGKYTELPAAPSWQFIPADHVFSNPQNPFQPPAYPEFAEITDLQNNAVRHFTAIKTGDVTDCTGDAQGPAFLTTLASNTFGQPGQQVTVDVTVQDFADVSGLQFSMQWNPTVASLDGVSNLNPALPLLTDQSFNTTQAAAGKLSVCWWTDVLSGSQALPNNTVLFSLTFTLVGQTGTSTPVEFVQAPTKFEVVNDDCDPFGLNTGNGLILVSDQPPPPTALQLVSSNATSINGAPVCAPVTASHFSDLTVVQFSLGWDPAVFAYQQLQNFDSGLGLSMAHFNTNQSGNGHLSFAWADPTTNGVSLTNGTVLFEVCFTPVGPSGTFTPFSFPGLPVPAEATDANGDAVPVQTTSGTLSISASNAPPVTVYVSPTPQTVASGTPVSVDVRVADFASIAGYQFSMSWDPAVLQFQSAMPKLPGMSTSGNFNTAHAAAGVLTHLFFEEGLGTLNLSDGSVLFTLNFVAVGAAGTSSPINFGGTPTPIAAYNGGLQPLAVTALAGLVHITAQGGFSVSGTVARASGTPVPAVLATMTGDATGSDLTGAQGDYGFANLATGSNLTVTPTKTADPLECVSVRDILFIFKHIYGIEPLANPYAMVAADANRSQSITSFDAAELRKLILGKYTELPNASSWQFIPADHVFSNPNNPFQQPAYPEFAEITDLQADAVRNFVAIKTGDATDCTGDAQGSAFLTTLASSANGTQGQQVTIDVTVQDFTDVSGLQFSMQWDPAVASLDQFAGVNNLNPALPQLTDQSFNTTQAAAGKLSVCWWTDLIAGPQALPDGTVLFSLTFTLVGPTGSSTPVAFVQTPTKFEVVNGTCEPFGLNTDDGLISITSQPPPPPFTGVQLVSGNATSVHGSAVCAPVCTSNFKDIISAQFSLSWDPTVFGFQQVKNFHQALGLNGSNFYTAQSGSGRLVFAWADPAATGVTLPSGAVLFEVCFIPVGPNGASTPLGFPHGPPPMEVADKAGAILPVQTVSGTLNIISGSATPVTVFVSPADQTVPSGTPVSVQIQAKDFASIAGYQFSMNWDPAVLQFQSASPALPGMTGGNFNTGNAANGVLSHLYYALNPGPLTLPDGSTLFSLNFIAVGAPGTSSPINFTAMPTPIAAYDGNLQPVPMTTLAGVVHISGNACAIACPSGVPALTTDSRCRAVLGDYTGLAALTGDCTGTVTQTPAPGTVVNPGTVAVTLTASGPSGETVKCVFNVTVSGGCGN